MQRNRPQARALRVLSTTRNAGLLLVLILAVPLLAHAQAGGSPFDTGFTALQNLFTGTIAKVASLSPPDHRENGCGYKNR
jgi:hypothetical protein